MAKPFKQYSRAKSVLRVASSEAPVRKKSLAETHPYLAKQWHRTKNGDLTPADATSGTHKKVWWKCPNGPDHEWLATVASRTQGGVGCPSCAGLG